MLSLGKVTFWWFSKIENSITSESVTDNNIWMDFFTQDSMTGRAHIFNFDLLYKRHLKQHNVMSAYFIKSDCSLLKLCFSWYILVILLLLCWRFRGTNSLEESAFWTWFIHTLKTFIYRLKDTFTKLEILTCYSKELLRISLNSKWVFF